MAFLVPAHYQSCSSRRAREDERVSVLATWNDEVEELKCVMI
jgi:hypothetical protein